MIAGLAAGSASLADALDFLADVANYAVSLLIVGMAWRYLLEGVAAGWARASIQSQSALVPRRPHRGRRQNHRRRKRHMPGVVAVGALRAAPAHGRELGGVADAALDQEGNVIAVVAPRRLLDSAKEPMEPPRQRKRSAPCRP